MKYIINCSTLKVGGALQVAVSFINYLPNFTNHTFLVIITDVLAKQIDLNQACDNIKYVVHNEKPNVFKTFIGINNKLSQIENSFNPDAVFTVFGPSYWRPKAKHLIGFARPSIVYFDSPYFNFISKKSYFQKKIKDYFLKKDFKNNADMYVTENPEVSLRLKNILNTQNVHTVTNCYNQIFDHESLWDKSISLGENDDNTFRLLTISANYPHKNLLIIKDVVKELKKIDPNFKFKFYVTQDEEFFGKDFCTSNKQYIQCLGKVNINQCPFLYNQTQAMFLPTLLECFSASYPEAMKMKNLIFTSNLNFAKGICGDAAIYFNPLYPFEIAKTIYETVKKTEINNYLLNGENQLKSFDNYESRAQKYINLLENI
jgi:glycosyltransferase involved in cell wall biosynthesis